jgi:predicted TIM-barrel fold metal-dependent hydrolase
MESSSRHYVIISADAHAGAALPDYKPYLERKFHDEFDAWAVDFHDPWEDFDMEMPGPDDEGLKMGRVSFVSPYSWDSDVRLAHMDQEGIAAEVVFPNTVPPFFPSGVITAPGPSTAEEYRHRWAGVQAHNRWLVDFCNQAPGRRIGLAQVFLEDVDEAVAEVHWAKKAGLSGILMPGDHSKKLTNIYERRLDPLWAACAELELPIHRHATSSGESEAENGPPALAVGAHEITMFFKRGLSHVVFGGVFERFPDLKFVFTESSLSWVPGELMMMDAEIKFGKTKGHGAYPVYHKAVADLSLTASEYWARNCWFGASMLSRSDVTNRDNVGVEKIMWGADYPHTEGSFPYTRQGLRFLFSGVPEDEVRLMTSENAAKVYGIDLEALQPLADRIGPTVEEIAVPLLADELPSSTMSVTIGSAIETLAHASS